MRIKKIFTFREANKVLDLIHVDAARGAFASYLGVDNVHDVENIKKHEKQIKHILENWGIIPKQDRSNFLNEAIWGGTNFDIQNAPAEVATQTSLIVSGFDEKSKPFAYQIDDEKIIKKLLKVIEMVDSEVGPIVSIGNVKVRKANCVAKALKLAKENGIKMEVTVNG